MAAVDLERARVNALAREIAAAFQRSGRDVLVVETADLEDVERWRRAARRAARLLGIHVRTAISRDGTRVCMLGFTDAPITEAMRRDAAARIGAWLFGSDT